MRPSTSRTGLALAAGVAVLLAAVVVALLTAPSNHRASAPGGSASSGSGSGSGFDGAALAPGVRAPTFTLRDQSGHQVSLAGARGRVRILAFLSSGCGAACVLVAQQIRGALDQLARPATVLAISVDPAGDTPARVRGFLAGVSLTGRVSYLGGTRAALARVWRAYHVNVTGSSSAAVERASTIVLIDASGRERVLFGVEQLTPESLAHDIRRLQAG